MAATLTPPTSANVAATLEPGQPRVLSPQTVAQSATLRSTAPEVCYSGRRFGGKSWVGCTKGYLYACAYRGAHVCISREERVSMEGTTLRTLREEVCPPGLWSQCWKESKSTLFLPNGSEIQVLGLDDPDRVLGSRYGFFFIDQAEQITRRQFEIANSCVMQVGMPWHQLLMAFNPDGPGHWAYRRFKPDEGDGPRFDVNGKHFADVIHVQTDDLLGYLTESSRERFDRMSGVWRLRLRLGQWASFEGLVFGDTWDPAVHVVPNAAHPLPQSWAIWDNLPPPSWPRYRGIDFGYEPHPYCCGWWAFDPVSGERYLYRQRYHTRKTIDQQADEILGDEKEELEALRAAAKRNSLYGYDDYLESLYVAGSWADHHRGEREMLDKLGVWNMPADKDVLAGLETVRNLLWHGTGPDGQVRAPKLYVVRNSLRERDPHLAELELPTCLEEEMGGYRWMTPREGAESVKARVLPVDKDNHAIDGMMRYVHHSFETAPRVMAA